MELIQVTVNELHAVYKDMLLQFPVDELKTFEQFTYLLTHTDYTLLLCKQNNETIGYILGYPNLTTKTFWLDYFAIFSTYHSHGYGSKILQTLPTIFPNLLGCFLEVEKYNQAIPNTIRRIRFYERLGAYNLNIYYALPTINGPFEMDLRFLPFQSNFSPSKEIISQSILDVFQTIHNDIPITHSVYKKISSCL